MKFFQPQIKLSKRINLGAPNQYILHATTYCDSTNYRAAGHAPLPEGPDQDGVYRVKLLIEQDRNAPDIKSTKTLLHTIDFGERKFEENGKIEVSLLIKGGGTPGGKVTVANSSATKEGRPIDES